MAGLRCQRIATHCQLAQSGELRDGIVRAFERVIERAHDHKVFFVELALCRDLVVAERASVGPSGAPTRAAALAQAAQAMPESRDDLAAFLGRDGIELPPAQAL